MNKINGNFKRFLTKTTKEFKNRENHVKIEEVKDTILHKKWYNVIWYSDPEEKKLMIKYLKFLYLIKSKTYNNEKHAIQHFNQIIKSQLQ